MGPALARRTPVPFPRCGWHPDRHRRAARGRGGAEAAGRCTRSRVRCAWRCRRAGQRPNHRQPRRAVPAASLECEWRSRGRGAIRTRRSGHVRVGQRAVARTDRTRSRRAAGAVSWHAGGGQAVFRRGSLPSGTRRRPRGSRQLSRGWWQARTIRCFESCPATWFLRSSAPHSTRAWRSGASWRRSRSRGEYRCFLATTSPIDLDSRQRSNREGKPIRWVRPSRVHPEHFPIPPQSGPGWRGLLPRRQVAHDNR